MAPLADTIEALKKRLLRWEQIGALKERERLNLRARRFHELSGSDQKRLKEGGYREREISGWGVDRDDPIDLHDGEKLTDPRLSVQIILNSSQVIGMNLQLSGQDPLRPGQMSYLRVDLDVVQMGADADAPAVARVIHRLAHCHAGIDPDADGVEGHDPRVPTVIAHPIHALDFLLLHYYPEGPGSVLPPRSP